MRSERSLLRFSPGIIAKGEDESIQIVAGEKRGRYNEARQIYTCQELALFLSPHCVQVVGKIISETLCALMLFNRIQITPFWKDRIIFPR